MDQVLTQQEIDLLLNAMSSGEIDQEIIEIEDKQAKVKAYDFRRPTKLSKEYVNTLHMIFEDFSKMSSSMLSTQLRTNVSLQLAAIEQVSYDEFIHSIPKFTLLGLFHSQPLSGIQMIEMNPQLCMMLVELLCGGLDVYQNKPIEMDFSEKKVLLILKQQSWKKWWHNLSGSTKMFGRTSLPWIRFWMESIRIRN